VSFVGEKNSHIEQVFSRWQSNDLKVVGFENFFGLGVAETETGLSLILVLRLLLFDNNKGILHLIKYPLQLSLLLFQMMFV
jgi:hypothetical protein